MHRIINADCLTALRSLPDNSVDAVVTDPPYGLSNTDPAHVAEAVTQWVGGDREFLPSVSGGFMGKAWDSFVPPVAVWDECLRVLKPGGHLLAFAGSRTQDLMGLSIRLAGFDIRDSFAWLYGSGFPKSQNVSKAIDKLAPPSTELTPEEARFCSWMREESGLSPSQCRQLFTSDRFLTGEVEVLNTATRDNPRIGRRAMVPTAAAWEAALPLLPEVPEWVSALVKSPPKPPMQTPSEWKSGKGEGTTGTNDWAGWGTALKPAFEPVIMARKPFKGNVAANVLEHGTGALNIDASRIGEGTGAPPEKYVPNHKNAVFGAGMGGGAWDASKGRFPANVLLDESQAAALDEQSGNVKSGGSGFGSNRTALAGNGKTLGLMKADSRTNHPSSDGGASRFYYVAKASKKERPVVDGVAHPTVKPLALMRYLVRMVTPPGGTVLEPFAGSGTTLEAALLEDFGCIAIEREAEYIPLIEARADRVLTTFMEELL